MGPESAYQQPASLEEIIRASRVVVFVSNLTDARPVTQRLEAAGIPFHTEIMGMGDPAMRRRFQELEARTAWPTLPQVFVDGRFVGGIQEALVHPLLASRAGLPERIRPLALGLGYGGLIPFVALAAALAWDGGWREAAQWLLAGYGAVILAFLGAVHWGRAIAGAASRFAVATQLIVGVLPALAGWVALALPLPAGLSLLALGFAGIWAFDQAAWQPQPELHWYRQLRTHLSIGAVVCLLIGALLGG